MRCIDNLALAFVKIVVCSEIERKVYTEQFLEQFCNLFKTVFYLIVK